MLNEIFLGLLQGITEWLPVSSSGHLVIYQELLETGTPIMLDLMLHVATLAVIFAVFYREIWAVARAVFRLEFRSVEGRTGLWVIVGSVPTAVIGLVFHDLLLSLYHNLLAVGIALLANGTILYFTRNRKGNKEVSGWDSLIIGTAQGLAIVPGISRSGATISAALYRGVRRRTAAAYSFMLAIPAILGAALLESRSIAEMQVSVPAVLASMAVAVFVGYFALRLLLRLVLQKKLHYFSYYCWVLGAVLVFFQLAG